MAAAALSISYLLQVCCSEGPLIVFKEAQKEVMLFLKSFFAFCTIVVEIGWNCAIIWPLRFEGLLAPVKTVNLEVN